MKLLGTASVAGLVVTGLLMARPAGAGPVSYDFAASPEGALGASAVFGPITASAWVLDTDGTWKASTLWRRNVANDHGLGVCSEGVGAGPNCDDGGDWNELSQLNRTEAILLTLATGWNWDGLYLSSLDSGGTGNSENGRAYWGNALGANFATIFAGSSDTFGYPEFGGTAVEGKVILSGFDASARHVLFVPGSSNTPGSNEDFLVWGADVKQVPDGGTTVTLLGSALLGAAALRRKFRA